MKNNCNFTVTNVAHVIYRETTKDWKLNTITSSKYILCLNLGGLSEYDVSGKNIMVCENDAVIFPPFTARHGHTVKDAPWRFISIAFDIEYAEGNDVFLEDIPMVTHSVPRHISDLFKKIVSTWDKKSIGFNSLCRAYIQQILCGIVQINEAVSYNCQHYTKIELVKNYINENFTKNITVKELADVAGLSQSHFRKIFREIVGMSATQYAISLRINKAKNLLISGTANVSEAAFQSGFKDVFYFSAMFKKVTGENPSKYLH